MEKRESTISVVSLSQVQGLDQDIKIEDFKNARYFDFIILIFYDRDTQPRKQRVLSPCFHEEEKEFAKNKSNFEYVFYVNAIIELKKNILSKGKQKLDRKLKNRKNLYASQF